MAKEGELWVKKVLENQGYNVEKIGRTDVFASKDKLGIVIEEKDWKDPAIVEKNKLYSRGIDGKKYYQKRSQVVNYGYKIKQQDMKKKIYRFIVCAFAVSNIEGRSVQPIYFRKFGTIFVVSKAYFIAWLKGIEMSYLGVPIENQNYYMGGK